MKCFCMLLLCAFTYLAQAQELSVYNKSNQTALEGVTISNRDGSKAIATDGKGKADISAFAETDSIWIRLIGFARIGTTKAALAQNRYKVYLEEVSFDLDEVVFTANRSEEKKQDIPQQIEVISSRKIEQGNPQTSADLLTQSGKVFMQMSQQGGGSPVIRGFESNRVLLVVDGVRMNNAIYRGGHLQNVITIDPNMLDRVEVMYGPGSVMYGSDALGGVMHFYTKRPQLTSGEKMLVNGAAFSRYSSANAEKSANLTLNLGWKKIASLTSFTYKDLDDLRAGANRNPDFPQFGLRNFYADRINGVDSMVRNADKNVQKYSGYTQYDLTQKILFRPAKYMDVLLNIQYSGSSNVPRYDRLTEFSGNKLRFAEWYYGPQNRWMGSLALELKRENKFYKSARITLAIQNIDESRIDRNFGRTAKRYQEEKVKVYTVNADFIKELKAKHELRYGLELSNNDVSSKAYFRDIVSDSTWNTKTRYPDGDNKQNSFALYFTHRWEINKKLIFSEGIRFSNISLKSSFIDTTVFSFPFKNVDNEFSAFNGNMGLVYLPGRDWRFNILGSTGFRAANLDDVNKFFDSKPGSVLVVPNAALKPEYVYSAELGIAKVIKRKVRVELSAFYCSFENIIITAPYQLNGQDSIVYSGKLSAVQANQNKRSAYISGFSANIDAQFSPSFSMEHSFTYTYGRLHDETQSGKDTLTPLDHIPPMYGQSSFILKKKKFKGEFFVRYAAWKLMKDYRLGAEDNEAYATAKGMPGWVTFNIRTEYAFNSYLRAQVAVENLLDYHYRYFASGISAPGRNFVICLRAYF